MKLQITGANKMIEIIPNWHPIWVHFAVALLTTSAVLFLMFGWGRFQTNVRTNALIVARWNLRLGVIVAIGALFTGYLASGSVTHDDVSHANMLVHRNWAFAATSIFAIIALIDYMKRNETRVSILSILLLVAGGVTLAVTGLEGAENVYRYGLGVQSLPDISTHEHSAGVDDSNDSNSATVDDGHNHSHEDAASASDTEISIEDSSHPASLLATELADAIAIGDVNKLRTVLAPDVLIFESGGMETSLAEYEGHHMPADMAFMKAMRREVISQQVIDSGDVATVVTRSRVYGNYKDKEIDLNSTETLVVRKLNGQWKVVHIHWSSG
jgi:uncharacterized membrane protein/ketosteroid isomerase-like protein